MKNPIMESLLQPNVMIRLYCSGAFPMAKEKHSDEIEWYMPEIRTIIPLTDFNIPRSLQKTLREKKYTVKYDNDFRSVIEGCSSREETWISPRLIEAYMKLHELGYIHTVEVYEGGSLSGGLYGIACGGAFFGESMFSYRPQGSKIALTHLIYHLIERGFGVLDVQLMTEHLRMFGAVEITMEEYNGMLKNVLDDPVRFVD